MGHYQRALVLRLIGRLAQPRRDHGGVASYLFRGAVCDYPPGIEADQPRYEPGQEFEIMLDNDQRNAGLAHFRQDRGQRLPLNSGEACGGFVKQQ